MIRKTVSFYLVSDKAVEDYTYGAMIPCKNKGDFLLILEEKTLVPVTEEESKIICFSYYSARKMFNIMPKTSGFYWKASFSLHL